MLSRKLTPKATALAIGVVVLLVLLIGLGARMSLNRREQAEESRMSWVRDREMGLPDTGLGENVSEEEKEEVKNRMLEDQMTYQRTGRVDVKH